MLARLSGRTRSPTILELTKLQILQQAGTSMLAQANQTPNSVLSLLRG